MYRGTVGRVRVNCEKHKKEEKWEVSACFKKIHLTDPGEKDDLNRGCRRPKERRAGVKVRKILAVSDCEAERKCGGRIGKKQGREREGEGRRRRDGDVARPAREGVKRSD